MIYAVIYELKNQFKDYSMLFDKLENYGPWMHYIDNFWIIESSKNSDEIAKALFPLIDQRNDYILVIKMTADMQGWIPNDAWAWITERRQSHSFA